MIDPEHLQLFVPGAPPAGSGTNSPPLFLIMICHHMGSDRKIHPKYHPISGTNTIPLLPLIIFLYIASATVSGCCHGNKKVEVLLTPSANRVRVQPGQTQIVRTFGALYRTFNSVANPSCRAAAADLVHAYGTICGAPTPAAMDAMVTTVPWFAATMAGRNSRRRRKWLRMLTWKTLLTDSSVVVRRERPAAVPALLTRMVGMPISARMEEAMEETSVGEVMSHLKKVMLGAGDCGQKKA